MFNPQQKWELFTFSLWKCKCLWIIVCLCLPVSPSTDTPWLFHQAPPPPPSTSSLWSPSSSLLSSSLFMPTLTLLSCSTQDPTPHLSAPLPPHLNSLPPQLLGMPPSLLGSSISSSTPPVPSLHPLPGWFPQLWWVRGRWPENWPLGERWAILVLLGSWLIIGVSDRGKINQGESWGMFRAALFTHRPRWMKLHLSVFSCITSKLVVYAFFLPSLSPSLFSLFAPIYVSVAC